MEDHSKLQDVFQAGASGYGCSFGKGLTTIASSLTRYSGQGCQRPLNSPCLAIVVSRQQDGSAMNDVANRHLTLFLFPDFIE